MGILPVGNPDQGIKWLSIDNIYEEYAICTQCPYGSEFDERYEYIRDGYRQADAGQAVVRHQRPGGLLTGRHGPLCGYGDGTEELIICGGAMGGMKQYSKEAFDLDHQ